MSKIIIRILAIIFMIPIVLIGMGASIIWNVYLIIDSIIRDIKRKTVKLKKRLKQKPHTYIGKKPNKMALTKRQEKQKNRTAMAKKTIKEQQKKGNYKRKS